jgi:hypothetical protein
MNWRYGAFARIFILIHAQTLILTVILCPAALGKYSGGTGEPNDPFLISIPDDLNAIGTDSNDWDKHFLLTADINMADYTGSQFNMIGNDIIPFLGVFDGNNHTVYNFTVESNSTGNVGLFSEAVGLVKNVGMADPCISAPNSVAGSLVGKLLTHGQVVSCWIEGGTIECLDGGGLIGRTEGQILQCYSRCNVSGRDVGGLTGILYEGTISQCFSDSSITGTNYVGGLVGYVAGSTITNCYATGEVAGGNYAGGLIGLMPDLGSGVPPPYIENCYSTASIDEGTSKGGLIASTDWLSNVLWSFWDVQASGEPSSAGGTSKDTSEMMSESTFFIWACQQCWTIDDGNDYPRLLWENRPGLPISKSGYESGTGTSEDPYLIYNAQQFINISLNPCDWEKHFKLMADIDLSGIPEGVFEPIGYDDHYYFSGVFDGSNHSISNLNYSRYDYYAAMFGYVKGADSEIKNLTLVDPNIHGNQYYVGALVGYLNKGTILNCQIVNGTVSGSFYVGGLTGYIQEGTIENSSSSAEVTASRYSGGIAGGGGRIYNSFASGDVNGQSYVGGLSGTNSLIANCYSSGSISGQEKVGGIIGYLRSFSYGIFNCYFMGNVTGTTDVGGLIGYNYNNTSEARSSYWDVNSTGCSQSAGGTPKTTAQMKSADTYLGWGCEGIWVIDEPNDYPHLWWENTSGEPIEKYYYSGGTGESNEPYIINSFDDFNMVTLCFGDWKSHFKLSADIDLSGDIIFKIGNSLFPFSGIFDGNGYSITNFSYTMRQFEENVGLFGIVDGIDAYIKNLTLTNPYIYGADTTTRNIAACVGNLKNGTINNCKITNGYVNTNSFGSIGGLVGQSGTKSIIKNCFIDCDVKGYWGVGGLIGTNSGSVYDSHWTGIASSSSSYDEVGGFVNSNYGIITRCSAIGQLSRGSGGFVCTNNGIIKSSYADVTIFNGNNGVGGFVGSNYNSNGKIYNCYAKGSIQGKEYVGGLGGYITQGNIENCYCLVNVTGTGSVGSVIGYKSTGAIVTSCYWDNTIDNHNNGIGTGLPTSQLKIKSTFTNDGWEFVEQTKDSVMNPWRMCTDNIDYPRLSWQFPSEDFLCPDRIDLLDYAILSDQWMLKRLQEDVVPDGGDYLVNFRDWAAFASNWNPEDGYDVLNDFLDEWLMRGIYNADIAPAGGDDVVDWQDLMLFCENWLKE